MLYSALLLWRGAVPFESLHSSQNTVHFILGLQTEQIAVTWHYKVRNANAMQMQQFGGFAMADIDNALRARWSR